VTVISVDETSPRWLRNKIAEAVRVEKQKAFDAGRRAGEREAMRRIMSVLGQRSYPAIVTIQQAVADFFGTRLIDMTSARRARSVARPRQVAMYLCRHLTEFSLPEIGRHFGRRDHTTVMHAIHMVRYLADRDKDFAASVEQIRAALAQPKT
jgi:chromosomal replication initiation ATPase DnaA